MFYKMPFILIAIILAIIFLNPLMPINLQQILYAVSLSIKSIIIFLLPIIIFGLLFKAIVNLTHNATRIILLMLIAICCSNFISAFLSHYVGIWIYNFDLSIINPKGIEELKPAWSFKLSQLITNGQAMFCSIIFGIIMVKFNRDLANKIASKAGQITEYILKVFSYLIPMFVAGFVVKLQADRAIATIVKDYTLVFVIVLFAQISYIALVYFIASHFRVGEFLHSIKNMIPAAISGFSTMSSVASMPLTIIGTENNTKNKDLARLSIPITVNIHLIGDCIAIPIFAYAVLKNYAMPEPALFTYIIFTFYFVLAKFSVAAIPGGGIIVMLPILETYLGFNGDMLLFITALYILFDPIITCVNILGNGAFAKMIDLVKSTDSEIREDKLPTKV